MTRIVFNGQEYERREAMPEDVGRAYDEVLAMLRRAHPELADAGLGSGHSVINVQRNMSIRFEGPRGEALPGPVRGIMESALRADSEAESRQDTDPVRPLETMFGMMLAFLAGSVFVSGIVLQLAIGGGRSLLAGRLMVAVAALLLLVWIDGMATRLARRRNPLMGPDSPGFRRFVVWSAAGLATAAVLLLGVAWYLP